MWKTAGIRENPWDGDVYNFVEKKGGFEQSMNGQIFPTEANRGF